MSIENFDEQDRADMARLARGNDAALNDLMARHAGKLFHYLLRQFPNETDAAELAQETFVRVYQNRERFRADAKFTTWLYTIATNLLRNRFRWQARHPQVSLDAEQPETGGTLAETIAGEDPPPGEELQSNERADAVRHAVEALPPDLRNAIILAEYEDKSQAEIAEILGCTVKAVEGRLARARHLLRTRLSNAIEVV